MDDDQSDDIDLIRAWYAGSPSAGKALHHRYEVRLQRYFGRNVPHQEVGELIQETWIAMTRNKQKAAGAPPAVRHVHAYILGIARHMVYAFYRKHASKPTFDPEVDDLATIAPSISRQFSIRRRIKRIELAMQSLPLDFQLIAEAHYLEGMTGPELAEMFEIPEGTVRSRLKRAKDTIDDLLRRWEDHLGLRE